MKISEAIDRLEVGDTVWVKGKIIDVCREENEKFPVGIELYDYMWLHENDEISLTEPQAEKVEVPSMIDKFIKYHADPIFEICAWSDHYGNDGRTCDDPELSVVLDWYGNNTTEFYEAVVNGYTVKPKRWVVKNHDGLVFSGFYGGGFTVLPRFTKEEHCYYKFTDKSKAEAVATLVEGSVEEVAE